MSEGKEEVFGPICMSRERFDALPKEKQRVEIARDVLQMIEAQKMIIIHNHYMQSSINWRAANESRHEPLYRDVIRESQMTGRPPSVCAIGSIFLAVVDRDDKTKLSDIGGNEPDTDEMFPFLEPWFSNDQLRLIEAAFEGTWHGGDDEGDDVGWDDISSATHMFVLEDSPENRMERIMQNIIHHNGDFKP